jgi:hypothetical protein
MFFKLCTIYRHTWKNDHGKTTTIHLFSYKIYAHIRTVFLYSAAMKDGSNSNPLWFVRSRAGLITYRGCMGCKCTTGPFQIFLAVQKPITALTLSNGMVSRSNSSWPGTDLSAACAFVVEPMHRGKFMLWAHFKNKMMNYVTSLKHYYYYYALVLLSQHINKHLLNFIIISSSGSSSSSPGIT